MRKRIIFSKIVLSLAFIFLGFFFRIFLKETVAIPNFEPITSLSILAGSFLGGVWGAVVLLLASFLYDIGAGNSLIFLFTWSAFLFLCFFGSALKRNSGNFALKATALSLFGVLFFYLYTNFGWWLIYDFYPKDFPGLFQCYIAALPFLKNQIASALIFAPVFSFIFSAIFNKIESSAAVKQGILVEKTGL